ncbi:MAG: tail fiber domain-containing protein [Alphaproteobacteria bacterium]|nr:tail fiber domain-containing protein [Alphaproteobacteria bacterium]
MSSGFKAVGKMLGAGGASTNRYTSENNILNYLKNYDTSTYDNTLQNLLNNAYNMSKNINNMGSYVFNVDGSDEARQRAENATYQAYTNLLAPEFEQQTNNLETRLQNQGIGVGSAAYNSAMDNLLKNQNNAYNEAAYRSVLAGQNAFNQSLNNEISAGTFANNAQNNYLSQILSQLQNSYSGYDNAMNIYNIQHASDARIDAAKQANNREQTEAGQQFLSSAIAAGLAMFSDERLKENIRPVGKLDNGLTVYCFNFVGSKISQLGLLAQEVAEVKPEAVFRDENGYLMVCYDLAVEDIADHTVKSAK